MCSKKYINKDNMTTLTALTTGKMKGGSYDLF
jgi:hypothetical protein